MALDLSKIKVEPIFDYYDLADAESMLSRYHPLGSKKAIGNRMTYTASYRGEWIAILVFDKAVDFNRLREREIGWRTEQVRERRKHIANNSRYLISAEYEGTDNLSSKILSLVAARISNDWQKHYGIPLLALETYVDPKHNDNTGVCYQAAGWSNLGLSSGHLHSNGERTHGKFYLLKALHKDSYKALSSEIAHALITGVKPVDGKSNNNYVLDASKVNLSELKRDLQAGVRDPRSRQGQKYPFVPLLTACISAVISGYTQYRQIADWISKLSGPERIKMGLPGDVLPHETTISKFMRRIDPLELDKVMTDWLLKNYGKELKTISLDGKALRGTSSVASEQNAYLNVFAHELGIVIHCLPTQKGGGEKFAAREVLDKYDDLTGKVILADAIHTDSIMLKKLQKKTPRLSSLSKTITNL
jgi:hypothetical protein